jgi:pimeloyl-ACP methyl ester carboxylesterase
MKFKQQVVQCLAPSGLHRMAYTEWGARDNPRVLVCVHGLTRNGRDFDALADAMSAHYRVICPDVVGRGQSSHLRDPSAYGIPQYVADMVTLIARLNVESVHWVGTSMGGLIGMALAALEGTPIRKLVLNDVGPVITAESLQRIGTYVGTNPDWATFDEALAFVKFVMNRSGVDRGSVASPDRNQRDAAIGRSLGVSLRSADHSAVQGCICRQGCRPLAAVRADQMFDIGHTRCALGLADTRYLAKDGFLRSTGKIGRN